MEGSVTPREGGGWEFEDARERPSRARAPPARAKRPAGARGRGGPISEAVQPRVKPPTQAQKNIAEIRQLLGERFDEIGRRNTALERFIPASGAGGSAAGGTAILGDPLGALRGAGPSQAEGTPGVLGVTAGPIDSAAALRDARAMLGRGTRESGGAPGRGAGEETPVGLVGGPPPGLPRRRRLQLAPRGPGSSRSTDSIRWPQPPPPGRELCWSGSSICWRAVPDGERVAPSYSGSGLVLSGVRTIRQGSVCLEQCCDLGCGIRVKTLGFNPMTGTSKRCWEFGRLKGTCCSCTLRHTAAENSFWKIRRQLGAGYKHWAHGQSRPTPWPESIRIMAGIDSGKDGGPKRPIS